MSTRLTLEPRKSSAFLLVLLKATCRNNQRLTTLSVTRQPGTASAIPCASSVGSRALNQQPPNPSIEGMPNRLRRSVTGAELDESISFNFTDGDVGTMTREEMLFHVITHGAYHRGNVG